MIKDFLNYTLEWLVDFEIYVIIYYTVFVVGFFIIMDFIIHFIKKLLRNYFPNFKLLVNKTYKEIEKELSVTKKDLIFQKTLVEELKTAMIRGENLSINFSLTEAIDILNQLEKQGVINDELKNRYEELIQDTEKYVSFIKNKYR